nr:hypothetical protein [Tanacetum cinerariifolium]
MSTTSDEIQAAGSDTRPLMLDRTDYESWAQQKKLGVTVEGEVMFELERPKTHTDLDYHEQERYKADFLATLFLLEGLPKDIYMLVNISQKPNEKDIVDPNTFHLKKAKTVQPTIYDVTTYALTASQFHELSIAYNVAKTCAVELEAEILNLHKKIQNDDHDNMVKHLSRLEENDCFQAENSKIKQHYKELYDSTKITHATHIEKITSLLNEIDTLRTHVKGKMPVIPNENVIPKGYLTRLKDTLDTLHEILEEPRSNRTSDNSLEYACVYISGIVRKFQASDLNVNKMASVDKSSGPAPQRKERCTVQCALSLKEEKSSYLRAVLTTTSLSSHAGTVNNSGLVQNLDSPTPYVPPFKKDYEILFQQLFDEYFNPPPRVVSPVSAAVVAPRAIVPVGLPSSTTIDQDVPYASTSPTTQEIKYQVTHQDPSSKEMTLQGFITLNLHHLNQSFDTLTKLTMNHPLENVIFDPSRSVLTRSQIQ